MTEEQMQAACATWVWQEPKLIPHRRMIFHVMNNQADRFHGNKAKAAGVCQGPSDWIFIIEFYVIFVELKIPGGTQSKEQIDFMEKVRARGHEYILIYSVESFKQLVLRKLNIS